MRPLVPLLAAIALAIGPAATATAKEIAAVKACGADGCRDVTAGATHAALDGGPPTTAPERGAPSYRLEITVRAEGETIPGWSLVYVPSGEKVQADDGTWMNPATSTLEELDRLVRGIEPRPAAALGLPVAEAAAAPASAPAPAPEPAGGGLPVAVWVLLIAGGAAGLALAARRLAPAVRGAIARRRGAAPAG